MCLIPFPIFFICIFAIRFYMIWQADGGLKVVQILISCLKFWDSKLLIQAYFGATNQEDVKQKILSKKLSEATGAQV